MEVTCERRDGVLWVNVSGRITILNAAQFEETVADEIEDGDRAVIIDLENLVYISSAGLYAVLRIAKIMWQRDAAFALCSLSDAVHLIFERIGFTKIIERSIRPGPRPWHPSKTEAATRPRFTRLAGTAERAHRRALVLCHSCPRAGPLFVRGTLLLRPRPFRRGRR